MCKGEKKFGAGGGCAFLIGNKDLGGGYTHFPYIYTLQVCGWQNRTRELGG